MKLLNQMLSRPKSVICFSILLLVSYHGRAIQHQHITVGEVINHIKSNINSGWNGGAIDTLKSGSMDQKVTGIATTFMATMEVLKKAKARDVNLIITHEPTFYNHFDNRKPLQNDPVQAGKLKFITDNNLVIWRFHDHWHTIRPDGINKGMIEKLGWEKHRTTEQDVTFNLPPTTLKELSDWIAMKFNTSVVRVVGNPEMKISKVALVPGAHSSIAQIKAIRKEKVDALVVGESREWETVEYVRDANELGMKKGLIIMGHADSEEAGMEYCAQWLKGFIKKVPITFIPAGNPLWSPK